MKNMITILSMCIACTFVGITQSSAQIDEVTTIFGVSTSAGFESEYNDKGRDVADNVVTTNFQIDIYDAYIGADGFWTVDKGSTNKIEAYAGYTLADLLLEGMDVDVGTDLNIYPNAGATDENYSIEPFIGLTFSDLLLTPSVYAYYDISYEQLTLEASVRESFTSENVIPFLGPITFTPQLFAGWSHIGQISPKTTKVSDGYTYIGGSLNASIEVHGFTVSAGPRYVVSDNAAIDLNDLSWGLSATYRF
jgi:hypothetical protein